MSKKRVDIKDLYCPLMYLVKNRKRKMLILGSIFNLKNFVSRSFYLILILITF